MLWQGTASPQKTGIQNPSWIILYPHKIYKCFQMFLISKTLIPHSLYWFCTTDDQTTKLQLCSARNCGPMLGGWLLQWGPKSGSALIFGKLRWYFPTFYVWISLGRIQFGWFKQFKLETRFLLKSPCSITKIPKFSFLMVEPSWTPGIILFKTPVLLFMTRKKSHVHPFRFASVFSLLAWTIYAC